MNHAEFGLLILQKEEFYYSCFVVILIMYLLVYSKVYLSFLDPFLLTLLNMAGGAFGVFFMVYNKRIDSKFSTSFVTTELALFTGIIIANYILPKKKLLLETKSEPLPSNENITEFDIFSFLISCIYTVAEIYSIKTVGLVVLDSDVTHQSAFGEHGALMSIIYSFRILMIVVLFYKYLVLKQRWNIANILCFILVLVGTLTSGSKSSILILVHFYFILTLPLITSGQMKPIKIPIAVIFLILAYPVVIISISKGDSQDSALQNFFIRVLVSGDIFFMGYNDDVMSYITEKSFFKWLFYPGWGSLLKNIGFDLYPPENIGVNVFEYYYGTKGGGANARYNYVGLYFLGYWGAIAMSFVIGLLVSLVRKYYQNLLPYSTYYFHYLLFAILAYHIPLLIDDIALFSTFTFWRVFFLSVSALASKLIFLFLERKSTHILKSL